MNQFLQDILRGLDAAHIQTVGNMQVIPLTGATEFKDVEPAESVEISSPQYGTLHFENRTSKAVIIPQGAAYVTKQAAQDHATEKVFVVAAGRHEETDAAMCVQSSQGGHFSGLKQELKLLPFTLRGQAHRVRKEESFRKLWTHIENFNITVGATARGHIADFYDKYDQQLEEFAAQFEIVPNQLGAIFLLGGKVVGIERAPNYAYWHSQWHTLVKDCYGGLFLYCEAKNILGNTMTATRRALGNGFASLADLRAGLVATEAAEQEAVRVVVRALMVEPVTFEKETASAHFLVESAENAMYVGQTVTHVEAGVIYVSLTTPEGKLTVERAKAFAI